MSRTNFKLGRRAMYCLLLAAFCLSALGCRYDMQDQPRYKPYKQSDFFGDNRASRDLPPGTVPRGQLRENKAFYTGKKENASGAQTGGQAAAPAATTATDASGNTLVASFPDAIEEFPVPVTKELLDRGEERYKVFCSICHGPTGNGDGMIVRRGFSQPPTYNDDRLRNAPVGHFYDVITNGWGKMNSYASMIPVADRWAIVAYIRALQISQNPNGGQTLPLTTTTGRQGINTTVPSGGEGMNRGTPPSAATRPAASPQQQNSQGGNR